MRNKTGSAPLCRPYRRAAVCVWVCVCVGGGGARGIKMLFLVCKPSRIVVVVRSLAGRSGVKYTVAISC